MMKIDRIITWVIWIGMVIALIYQAKHPTGKKYTSEEYWCGFVIDYQENAMMPSQKMIDSCNYYKHITMGK